MSVNLVNDILDFSLENKLRIELFKEFYNTNRKNDSMELLYRICGMYQFSGSKIIESFLYDFINDSDLSGVFKLESAQNLILYYELEEEYEKGDSEEDKKVKDENNEIIRKRNENRKNNGYKALDIVCSELRNSDISIPCQINAIIMLMKNTDYRENSNKYFIMLINDLNIDCDYRYKTILSLEKKDVKDFNYFIKNSCIEFLNNEKNMTMYRILSAQYLLQNCEIEEKDKIQDILLGFSNDKELDYNLRADAADTLLSLGTQYYKDLARDIILCLGRTGGNTKTIYNNAQNVHTKEIEKSVLEILNVICSVKTMKINNLPIDFYYIEKEIKNLIDEKRIICENDCKNNKKIQEKENYCSENCQKFCEKEERIFISLNRIFMDRTLYSAFTSTLSNILVKLWSYIQESEYKDEMIKRLLEELDEMSGTCSSGFVSRLVNVISGFDEKLSIRISYEDQIIANMNGRLNQRAQKILDEDSKFYNENLNDVIELYINSDIKLKKYLINKIIGEKTITFLPTMKQIISEFLKEDKELKIKQCIDIFSENVLNEMMLDSYKYANRQNFSLFFRTYISDIREELFVEFKEILTPTEFDLCIRKAISMYEGVNYLI
jgi:hypothetical protein